MSFGTCSRQELIDRILKTFYGYYLKLVGVVMKDTRKASIGIVNSGGDLTSIRYESLIHLLTRSLTYSLTLSGKYFKKFMANMIRQLSKQEPASSGGSAPATSLKRSMSRYSFVPTHSLTHLLTYSQRHRYFKVRRG